MVEGLAEVFGNSRVEGKYVYIGTRSASNISILRRTPLLPLNTLFEVNRSSAYYNEQNKMSIFYAESWALTHYLITRDWRENTIRMDDFITLLRQGVPQTEAARRTIGDPEALQAALGKYVQSFGFMEARLKAPKIDEGNFSIRTLSDAESLTVRADFAAHDGRFAKAQEMLEEAIKMDPRLGAVCEGMSLVYAAQDNIAEASKWASQAMSLNPQGFRANYYNAVLIIGSGFQDEQSLSKAESSLRTGPKD